MKKKTPLPTTRVARGSAAARTRTEECYVYIQLPGETESVTCGRFTQTWTRTGAVAGAFVYGRTYLARANAVPLDPIHLPLQRGTFQTAARAGIFGALRDSSPDAWGRRVIERQLGKTRLSEIDYLLHSPEDRVGAQSFGLGAAPPAPVRDFNRVLQLQTLFEIARALDEQPGIRMPVALRHQIDTVLHPGTSLGGARPKNVVEDDDGLWIAKFPRKDDRWNYAAVEAGMLALARRCGIRTPPARVERVGGSAVLLVKRFDRERTADGGAYARHRMVSGLTVLDADEMDHSTWSYLVLADELRRWSHRIGEDRRELYCRMVFNALVSNTDDHPRNHAFIAPGRDWQLAPAYDLMPTPMPGSHERDLAMECGRGSRRASRVNLLTGAPRFGLTVDEVGQEIDRLKAIVSREWAAEVRRAGGSAADCDAIASAFVDRGFEYEAP